MTEGKITKAPFGRQFNRNEVGYGWPLLLAIMLHALVVGLSIISLPSQDNTPEPSSIVQATLVSTETFTDQAQQPIEQPTTDVPEESQETTLPDPGPSIQDTDLASEQAEAQRQREAEAEAEAQRQREAEAEAQRQREAEARRAAELAERARQAEQAQNSFTNIVKNLVEQAWIIPPSSSNNASVVLNIRLGPSGEVLATSVVSSTGDGNFDRSAQQAVEHAAPFRELRDVPAEFQRNLRQFNLRFTPGDVR